MTMFCNNCRQEITPYAFKVFYIGSFYSGFQRQPHGFTVEDFIEAAFINQGYICNFSSHSYRAVSRTDVGVNALSNVFFINLPVDPEIGSLNNALPSNGSILLLGWTKLSSRSALYPIRYKIYRYFLPSTVFIPKENLQLLSDLIGTYDFTPFIKMDRKAEQKNICKIHSIDFQTQENGLIIQFVGDHFGWQQIRKMVGFIATLGDSRALDDILTSKSLINAPPFPGEFLVLYHIQFSTSPIWINLPQKKLIEKVKKTLQHKIEKIQWYDSLFSLILK